MTTKFFVFTIIIYLTVINLKSNSKYLIMDNLSFNDSLITRSVFFDFKTRALDTVLSKVELDRIAAFVTASDTLIEVSVHNDTRYNKITSMNIAQYKAEQLKSYLCERLRLNADKVIAIGCGSKYPILEKAQNDFDYYQNRRIEIWKKAKYSIMPD